LRAFLILTPLLFLAGLLLHDHVPCIRLPSSRDWPGFPLSPAPSGPWTTLPRNKNFWLCSRSPKESLLSLLVPLLFPPLRPLFFFLLGTFAFFHGIRATFSHFGDLITRTLNSNFFLLFPLSLQRESVPLTKPHRSPPFWASSGLFAFLVIQSPIVSFANPLAFPRRKDDQLNV